MRKLSVYIGLLLIPVFMLSCKDDKLKYVESPDKTVIESIKLLNAGANGNEVLIGTVDENEKTIAFPEVNLLTDLSALRFEATLSDGATLDSTTYDFTISQGEIFKEKVIKVLNKKRFREYYVTITYDVPPTGGDFGKDKVKIYDYTAASSNVYPGFGGQTVRSSGCDGTYVLVVSRPQPYLIAVSEIIEKGVGNKGALTQINLNLTGVVGSFFSGRISNGHVYLPTLGAVTRIYHWAPGAYDQEPQLLTTADLTSFTGPGGRFGDAVSVNLDANGDGHIFLFPGSTGFAVANIVRIEIKGYNEVVGDPARNPLQSVTSYWPYCSYNRIPNTEMYMQTTVYSPVALVDVNGSLVYTMKCTLVQKDGNGNNMAVTAAQTKTPSLRAADVRVASFNGENYIMMPHSQRIAGDFYNCVVYGIGKSEDDVIGQIINFDEKEDKSALLDFSHKGALPGSGTTNPCADWFVKGDKLYFYVSDTDAGFALIEVPTKVKEPKN